MNPTPPRRSLFAKLNRTKNQTLLVAVVGIIVALAFFLASLFTGSGSGLFPGLGADGNGSPGSGKKDDNTVSTDPPAEELDSPQSFAPTPRAEGSIQDHAGDVLFLRVMQHGYEVRRTVNKKATYEPATLPNIVKLARQSDGDDKGIKVIVEVAWNATSASEAELQKLLTAPVANGGAGLDNNSIMTKKDF